MSSGYPKGYRFWTDEAKAEYEKTRPRCWCGRVVEQMVDGVKLCKKHVQEAKARCREQG
jgi:hypothetical protein